MHKLDDRQTCTDRLNLLTVSFVLFQSPFNIFSFYMAGYYPDANFFKVEPNTGIVRLSQNIALDNRERYVVCTLSISCSHYRIPKASIYFANCCSQVL